MNWQAKWIKPENEMGHVVPVFSKTFTIHSEVKVAYLYITSMGIYEAKLNNQRVGKYVLAPGWTSYQYRLQYQKYDVTDFIQEENQFTVQVAKGWYRGILSGDYMKKHHNDPIGLLAQIEIEFADGNKKVYVTDDTWKISESQVRFSEIYDGEIYDARVERDYINDAEIFKGYQGTLISQEGEEILEQEIFKPKKLITTPKGEVVIDFGQEITGYVEINLEAKSGEMVHLLHGEMLDKDGNFYNENYRKAKAEYKYICKDGLQSIHPHFTFYGFRYVKVNEFPGGIEQAKAENFKAIVVYSDIKQTGFIRTSNTLLNQFFSNVIWSQKDNFLDVPTDCPQRDERLGWLGDAQVFVRTAALNFDVEKFFRKWLADMRLEQKEDGFVPQIVPDIWNSADMSSGWGDAITICPWELYLAYGNKEILEIQYESMTKYVNYITTHTEVKNLWVGGFHYGDWLGMDSAEGSYEGASRKEMIATAYYARSVGIVVKAGKILDKDVKQYEKLYQNIVETFQSYFPKYYTQTECALAVCFHLAKDCREVSDQLAEMIIKNDMKLQTGFIGTPYLLHALSEFGHVDIAYSLLLQTKCPSWLYCVLKGATTTWEHWDGIKENGEFWDVNMNSFNHYAYGAVVDWIYMVAAGIKTVAEHAGYSKVRIEPLPDERLDWLDVSLKTRHGVIQSSWKKKNNGWFYEIVTPVEATIVIEGVVYHVAAGEYQFYGTTKRFEEEMIV